MRSTGFVFIWYKDTGCGEIARCGLRGEAILGPMPYDYLRIHAFSLERG